MDNVRDCNRYQQEALSRFWSELKDKSEDYIVRSLNNLKNTKTIELTKDQYYIHEESK